MREVIMEPYFVVSDLHMGNGTSSDDFKTNKKKFKDFLKHVRGEKGQLILAGDIFELWQADLQTILKSNVEIIEILFDLRPIALAGNHDYYMKTFADLNFLYYPAYTIDELGVRIEHGHEYDPNNDPKRNMELGKVVASIGGMAENWIHKDIDEDFMSFVGKAKRVAHEIWDSISTPWKDEKEEKKSPDLTPYERAVEDLTKKEDAEEKISHVIFGHTHRPEIKMEGRYINSGSWVTEKTTFVEITSDEISLCEFKSKGKMSVINKVQV